MATSLFKSTTQRSATADFDHRFAATRSPRVAIVSDPLVQRGGAERCVEALAEAFPEAPIFAILYDEERGPSSLAGRVVPSFLNSLPFARTKHRAFWPLYSAAVESFDLSGFDVVLSSHHTSAKGVVRRADQLHVCYCHTPMRLLWERYFEELAQLPPLLRPLGARYFSRQRALDYFAASAVDVFLANSHETRRRIASHYGRSSRVVYPPIDLEKFLPAREPASDFFLLASRAVPYKRFDVAVDAAIRAGVKLVVTSERPSNVREHANVEFRGRVSDRDLVSLMQRCRALVFPQKEDFGMTPLEVNACGRPVVAFAAGGALETVRHGVTGLLVERQDPADFAEALARIARMPFESEALRAHAERFSRERYIAEIRESVEVAWIEKSTGFTRP